MLSEVMTWQRYVFTAQAPKQAIATGAKLSAVVNLFVPLADWFAVSPNGNVGVLWISMLSGLPLLGILLALPFLFVGLAFAKVRRRASSALLASLAYLIIAYGLLWVGGRVRMHAFHELAVRSEVLVSAIQKYHRKTGSFPSSLDKLTPGYLPAVPVTGMGAYPEFRYIIGEKARTRYDGNEWVLVVDTPSGGINFDTFIYYPNQKYPVRGHGGVLERIGRWAYVHE